MKLFMFYVTTLNVFRNKVDRSSKVALIAFFNKKYFFYRKLIKFTMQTSLKITQFYALIRQVV